MTNPLEQIMSRMAELDRRLRAVEGGQRAGMSSVQSTWMTGNADQTVFDSQDLVGPAGATWANDAGETGTGWPQMSVTSGTRVLVMWSCLVVALSSDAAYRSRFMEATVRVNGEVFSPLLPVPNRSVTNANTGASTFTLASSTVKSVTPGTNVYKLAVFASNDNPAGIPPFLSAVAITIIPLTAV